MAVKGYIPAVKYGNKVSVDEENHSSAVQSTNATTAVSVFGAALSNALVISDVIVTALDTTASNITVENPEGTVVCTIAKGVTAGVVTGATTLANTTVTAGNNLVVKSSGAGNARVKIFFTNTGLGAS